MTINVNRYIVQPDADGAKPMSEMEYNVVDTLLEKVVNRCPSEREAYEIANYLNQRSE